MKIALVCNMGGHLTEMLFLIEAFENHDVIFITYKDPRIEQLKYRKYLMENIGTNMWKMIKMFFKTFKILRKERPDLIVSTGSEIAIPSFILARLMSIKTIYIESWCRVKTKSGTGKILYHFSNVFLVQWPNLLKKYGKKAIYEGGVL
jgi:UDP-N-acetylglucosamine:LPS N-acetylglucosamine transferase